MKRKIIKILSLLFIILLVFEIYTYGRSNKLNYIALGDSLAEGQNPYGEIGYSYTDYLKDYLKKNKKLASYTKEHAESKMTTEDLIKDLKYKTKLKKDLRQSDLVTLSIGADDLLEEIGFRNIDINKILNIKEEVDKIIPKVDACLKEIRKYAKNDIILVGYYNPIPFLFNTSGSDLDYLFAYIDEEYKKLSDKYNCKYVSVYQLFKTNSNYLPNPSSFSPNLDGYKSIANKIIKEINL